MFCHHRFPSVSAEMLLKDTHNCLYDMALCGLVPALPTAAESHCHGNCTAHVLHNDTLIMTSLCSGKANRLHWEGLEINA